MVNGELRRCVAAPAGRRRPVRAERGSGRRDAKRAHPVGQRSGGGPVRRSRTPARRLAGASAAVGEVLREAGDSSTQISTQGRDGFSTYGQTEWSLANQQQFVGALAAGCVGSQESREYVLGLMGEVSSDTWGPGSAGLPARWKGGWDRGATAATWFARWESSTSATARPPSPSRQFPPTDSSKPLSRWRRASPSGWPGAPKPWQLRPAAAD